MTRIDLAPLGRPRPMRALLLGTAFAALATTGAIAETLSVTGIAPAGSGYGLNVPSIDVVDGNLDEAAVRALFAGTPGSLDPLATLTAKSVTIPEISFSYKVEADGAAPVVVSYRDLVLSDVENGVAASATVGSVDVTGAEGFAGKFGEISAGKFDLGGLLGFYGLTHPAGGTEMKEVYSNLKFGGGTMGADGVFSCEFGPIEVGSFSARPLKQSMADIQALLLETEADQKAGKPVDPAKVKQIILFYTDMFTAFSSSPMSFDGFDCSGKDDKGQQMTIAAGGITVGGFKPAVYPEFSLDDFKIDVAGDGHLNFGNFTWKQMDFSTAIATLEAAATLDEAYFTANWRKLIPAMDGFSLTDLDVDTPNPDKPGERVTGTIGSFDATLGNYVNGIPADIKLNLGNFILPLTADMKDLPVQDLLAAGISELDVSLGTQLAWDQATSTIKVSDVTVDLGSLGKLNLSGTFGNATDALFGEDENAALVAAQMITLKDVTLEVEDRGIGQLIFASGAKEAGQPEETFRTAVAGMAQGMTLAFLGNTTEALTAAQQLGTFLQGSSHLKLVITAKDEAGIGLADLAAAEQNPTVLAGKLNVVAEASGEPATLAAPAANEPEANEDADETVQNQKRDLKAPSNRPTETQ